MILSQGCQVNKLRPLMSSKFPWQSVESQVSRSSETRWGGSLKVHFFVLKRTAAAAAAAAASSSTIWTQSRRKKWIRKFHWHSIFYHHRAMRWKKEKIWTKDRNAGFQSLVCACFLQADITACMICYSLSREKS